MYLTLVAGGHAAGKRTVSNGLVERVQANAKDVCVVKTKSINLADYQRAKYNPDVDFKRLHADLEKLETETKEALVVFVHGNYALYDKELCLRAELKLYLDVDADMRLSQWIMRDTFEQKRMQLSDLLQEYLDHCRPEYQEYIEDTKKQADVLLPLGSDPLTLQVLATGIVDEIAKGHVTPARGRNRTPVVNLRAEASITDESRYYVTT